MADGNGGMSSDPRVYFASERTLLAWVRTGIAIVGLGFVVARFGLFLRMLGTQNGGAHANLAPTILGVALTLAGAGAMLAAMQQHRHFVKTLPAQDLPARYSRSMASIVAAALAGLSFLLAAYLALDTLPG